MHQYVNPYISIPFIEIQNIQYISSEKYQRKYHVHLNLIEILHKTTNVIMIINNSFEDNHNNLEGRQLHLHVPCRGHHSNPVQSRSEQKYIIG